MFKKSILALESLVGFVLSIIVLVLLFHIFIPIFFPLNSNLKIAENNAKSISNFININNKLYNLKKSCYSELKLTFLQNLQTNSNKNHYLYIIDKNGIHIINQNDFSKLYLKSSNLIKIFIKNYYFTSNNNLNPINLYIDNTKDGSSFWKSFTWFGKASSTLQLTKYKKIFFILKPNPKSSTLESYHLYPSLSSNINSFDLTFVKQGLDNYLIYNPILKEFFFSNSKQTRVLINSNLCYIKQLQQKISIK